MSDILMQKVLAKGVMHGLSTLNGRGTTFGMTMKAAHGILCRDSHNADYTGFNIGMVQCIQQLPVVQQCIKHLLSRKIGLDDIL